MSYILLVNNSPDKHSVKVVEAPLYADKHLQTLRIIEEYKNKPVLWDQYSKDYYNKKLRARALEDISRKCGVTPEYFKKKINILRTQYLEQCKRALDVGSSFVSKWHYYDPLNEFLQGATYRNKAFEKSSSQSDVENVQSPSVEYLETSSIDDEVQISSEKEAAEAIVYLTSSENLPVTGKNAFDVAHNVEVQHDSSEETTAIEASVNTEQVLLNKRQVPVSTGSILLNGELVPVSIKQIHLNSSQLPATTAKIPVNSEHLSVNSGQGHTNSRQVLENTGQVPRSARKVPANTLQAPASKSRFKRMKARKTFPDLKNFSSTTSPNVVVSSNIHDEHDLYGQYIASEIRAITDVNQRNILKAKVQLLICKAHQGLLNAHDLLNVSVT